MSKLLLVDDDVEVAEVVRDALESAGHEVRVACDGCEGLRLLREDLPDLLLLDVEMPVLNGPGVVHRMLILDAGMQNVPVALLSGVDRLADLSESLGTPYFLVKPFRLVSLTELIERALKERAPPRPPAPSAP